MINSSASNEKGLTVSEYCRKNFKNLPKTVEYDKMVNSVPYESAHRELTVARGLANERALDYQKFRLSDFDYDPEKFNEARSQYIKDMFGKTHGFCLVEYPFYVDYGSNIEVGEGFYANFGCTFLDCSLIKIGAKTSLGPNVTITTANHPSDPEKRFVDGVRVDFAEPVEIGSHCWIGANAVIVAGVTIGDYVVVGAGAVINRDIPSNSLVVGVPGKVVRQFKPSEFPEIAAKFT